MPRNSLPKLVVAHFMVGNTYPYIVDDWAAGRSLVVINVVYVAD